MEEGGMNNGRTVGLVAVLVMILLARGSWAAEDEPKHLMEWKAPPAGHKMGIIDRFLKNSGDKGI